MTGSGSGLQRQLVDHLDHALLNLSMLDEDPRTAVEGARRAIEQAEALLSLLAHLDRRTSRDLRRTLRHSWTLLTPVLEHRSRLRPGAPPPLAPSVRSWVTQAKVALLAVRQVIDLPLWRAPIDLAVVVANAASSYRKARKQWTKGGSLPDAKTLRAARRVRFHAEALCPPKRLAADARYRAMLGPDLGLLFSATPNDHARWLARLAAP